MSKDIEKITIQDGITGRKKEVTANAFMQLCLETIGSGRSAKPRYKVTSNSKLAKEVREHVDKLRGK